MSNPTLGYHVLVEMYQCNEAFLDDPKYVEETLVRAADLSGATVVSHTFHQFSPYGVSGVVVVSESHLAIHTWPEHGYASLDLYTCGDVVDTHGAFSYIREKFEAGHSSTTELRRGDLKEIEFWKQARNKKNRELSA